MAAIKKPPERGGGTVRHGNAAAAVAVTTTILVCATSAAAQARAGLERAQENAKREAAIRIAKDLDDCAAVPTATVDILRHGESIINYEAREIDANVNRSLLGTASGVFTGALGLPFNPASVTAGGYRNVPLQSLSREELRTKLQDDFVAEVVRRGLRQPCSAWAEDLAWSYAPGGGNECAGLDNEAVDTLRRSGEFFHQDRWEVRMAILQRYREDGASCTCQEYADRMATEARILDP